MNVKQGWMNKTSIYIDEMEMENGCIVYQHRTIVGVY